MDLTFSEEEQAFRAEVRRFVAERLPADVKHKVENGLRLEKDDYLRWQKALYEKGWAAPGWPAGAVPRTRIPASTSRARA